MIDRLKIWLGSRLWFWKLRTKLKKIAFLIERSVYTKRIAFTKAQADGLTLSSFAWIGAKSLVRIAITLVVLIAIESYLIERELLLAPLSAADKEFNIDQLRLYAQLLSAIFSIYFATIGIILSAGYTRFRRDIIYMLTTEQVSSAYSRILVNAAMFCLAATALPVIGFEPGLLVYISGTILTLLSALALFPLGRRLFNFFDLNILGRAAILPKLMCYIDQAANQRHSISLANHHSKAAKLALEQLSYIDERIKANKESLRDNLPALTQDYTHLLLYYLARKHEIDQESYWFPRRSRHRRWFLAGDAVTSMALQTSSQQLMIEQAPAYDWLENDVVDKLSGHLHVALQVGDFDLAVKLLTQFSSRVMVYAKQFQFHVGMQEIKEYRGILEKALTNENSSPDEASLITKISIADTWAALGSTLCLETLRRMITFESELKKFFDADIWNKKSLQNLPAFLQLDLAIIIKHIQFEQKVDGRRLSKPKYLQQLAVQKLLQNYAKSLAEICDFYFNMLPEFVSTLTKLKMPEAATQVILASLHSYWILLARFDEISELLARYREYEYYTAPEYELPPINMDQISAQLKEARDNALATLGKGATVEHIFKSKHNDDLPDHFGQIYFELAEACIRALEQNNADKLDKVLPMFLSLAFLAPNLKFSDPSLEVSDEFRFHLISTVIKDMASVLGFTLLYGAYFDNKRLFEGPLAKFDDLLARAPDKQAYLKNMIPLCKSRSFGMSAPPREMIRMNWQMSFQNMAHQDGFGDPTDMMPGQRHPNKIVREFLNPLSHVSDLFIALHIWPNIEAKDAADIDIDHEIIGLSRRLSNKSEDAADEDS